MERRNKAAQFNLHETNVMVMIRILHVCGFGTKKKKTTDAFSEEMHFRVFGKWMA